MQQACGLVSQWPGFDTATNTWVMTVPYNFTDNIFLTGVAYTLPAAIGNNTGTTWSGQFSSDVPGFTRIRETATTTATRRGRPRTSRRM